MVGKTIKSAGNPGGAFPWGSGEATLGPGFFPPLDRVLRVSPGSANARRAAGQQACQAPTPPAVPRRHSPCSHESDRFRSLTPWWTWYLFFSVWLTSPSRASSESVRVVTNGRTSFFSRLNPKPPCAEATWSYSIRQRVDVLLPCFCCCE